jgi:predicted nucleic acid-binding protein
MARNFTVIYDANLFYPAFVRNVMLYLARAEIFRARWTDKIHEEWMRNLAQDKPDIMAEKLERLRTLIDKAVPDCLVTGFEQLAKGLDLPDPGDNHVLAAAIKAGAQVIVTYNLKDFPLEKLAPFDIEAQHPDDFVQYQKEENQAAVLEQLKACRLSLRNPPYSATDFIASFQMNRMPLSAAWLEQNSSLI